MLPVFYALLTGVLAVIGTYAEDPGPGLAELMIGHGFASAALLGAHVFVNLLLLR